MSFCYIDRLGRIFLTVHTTFQSLCFLSEYMLTGIVEGFTTAIVTWLTATENGVSQNICPGCH